jgi:flagellar basal-body rod modification protein FlgD
VVDTRILTPDTRSLSWDGLLATGALAQPGLYSLSLDARDTSGNTMTSETESLGIVQSVSQQDGVLNFTVGGVPVTADALRNIALPPSGN